jgi:hypothetical protein
MVVAIMNHRRKGKKGYTVSYLLSFVIFILHRKLSAKNEIH